VAVMERNKLHVLYTGVVRPQQMSSVTSGIAFHPLSASMAAATRPGFYFAAQPAATVPRLTTSAASSLASGTVIGPSGAREPGMTFY